MCGSGVLPRRAEIVRRQARGLAACVQLAVVHEAVPSRMSVTDLYGQKLRIHCVRRNIIAVHGLVKHSVNHYRCGIELLRQHILI